MSELKFALFVLNPPFLSTRKLFKLPAAGITFNKVRSAIKEKWAVPDHTSIKNIQYMDEDFGEYLDLDADVLESGVVLFKLKVTFDRGMRSPACPSVPHAMLILFEVWIHVSFISLSVGNAEISGAARSSTALNDPIIDVVSVVSSSSDSSSDDDSHPKADEPLVHQASQPGGHSICSFPTSRSTMRLGIYDTYVPVEPFSRRCRVNRIASLNCAMLVAGGNTEDSAEEAAEEATKTPAESSGESSSSDSPLPPQDTLFLSLPRGGGGADVNPHKRMPDPVVSAASRKIMDKARANNFYVRSDDESIPETLEPSGSDDDGGAAMAPDRVAPAPAPAPAPALPQGASRRRQAAGDTPERTRVRRLLKLDKHLKEKARLSAIPANERYEGWVDEISLVKCRIFSLREMYRRAESISDMESDDRDEEKGAATVSAHNQKRRRLQGRHPSINASVCSDSLWTDD